MRANRNKVNFAFSLTLFYWALSFSGCGCFLHSDSAHKTNELFLDQQNLVVMSFNIWNSGMNVENGQFKIAKHILYNNPDIVAVQEVLTSEYMKTIVRHLGPGWSAVAANSLYPDVAIFTRHKILQWSDWTADGHASTVGYVWAKIQVTNPNGTFPVHFWSIHLDWKSYGPYAACNKMVTKSSQIDAGEWGDGQEDFGRAKQAYLIVNSAHFQKHMAKSDQVPMILAGDFNSPSHLDWTLSTKIDHCDWVYEWPTTLLMTNNGLIDSFRHIYPCPKQYPGCTWSTVRKAEDGWNGTIPEPQERIDMIFYASSTLIPSTFSVYSGYEVIRPYPEHNKNDYPSDHYAVVATFSNANLRYEMS